MDTSQETTKTRQWALALHLSQLGSYLIPLSGLIAPIVIWQLKKNEMPAIEEHGRAVANWIITAVIAAIVFGILARFALGIPLLIGLGVANAAFAIIGAIKAREGTVWKYPLSYPFLSAPGEIRNVVAD